MRFGVLGAFAVFLLIYARSGAFLSLVTKTCAGPCQCLLAVQPLRSNWWVLTGLVRFSGCDSFAGVSCPYPCISLTVCVFRLHISLGTMRSSLRGRGRSSCG